MALVLDLSDAAASTLAEVGGKAQNLHALLAAGLPVPVGFCITTEAYRLVVGDRLDELLDHLETAAPPASVATELRARVAGLRMPDPLRDAVLDHYRRLGHRPAVAVRSSATAEDLAGASAAGQQDTYLNVVGEDALLDAVRRCWASLWTERAVSYRTVQGIDQRRVALAVVVQRMVDARVAGVMFTANPVTGARHETVINAAPGLGEAVVSGAVDPDHFVVDRGAAAVVERRPGNQRLMIVGRPGGGVERRDRPAGQRACLDDDQVWGLVALGQQVQDHFGAPQDTEWAIDGDARLWLTQARPITTLYPQVQSTRPGLRVLLCLSLAQGLTRPVTPMGLAAFRLIGSSVAATAGHGPADPLGGPRGLHDLGGRVYLDLTEVLRNRWGRRVMIQIATAMEARTAPVLRWLGERPEFTILDRPAHSSVRPVLRVLRRARMPQRVLTAALSPGLARRDLRRIEARLRAVPPATADSTPTERLDSVQRRLGEDLFLLMPTVFAYAAAGFACLGLARRLLRGLATPEEIQQVQRSLPDNVTTEMDLELWRLTTRIRADEPSATAFAQLDPDQVAASYARGRLPAVAQQGLRAFLGRYGHRAVAEIDLGLPRWTDDPRHLVGMINNYLRSGGPDLDPVAQFERGRVAAETMVDTLVGRARGRGRLQGRIVGWSLCRARELTGLRETPKFLMVLALSDLRTQLSRVGSDLEQAGRLGRADDIFFLDFCDARRGLGGADLRPLVDLRRSAYAGELRRRHIPRLLLSDGTEPEAVAVTADRPDGTLSGRPASAGTVSGRARVVLDPIGAHLEPGEILVAPSTDPGWTPLFLTAGGLVMEMGGANSHGAVVAREYGIPAVVGVPDATHRIETGQLVTVDGASGLVTLDTAG